MRNITTGRLVQVIEGTDLRLLRCEHKDDSDTTLIAQKGGKDDKDGVSDQITELVDCGEYNTVNWQSGTREPLGRMRHVMRGVRENLFGCSKGQ
jgi:hypothetical protein